jgi:hypothetical protein
MSLAHNYYVRSWKVRAVLVMLLAFATACGGANGAARDAPRVPFARLNQEASAQKLVERLSRNEPVVIQFEAGQVIPVDYAVDSRLFELTKQKTQIVVREDFQLLLWDGAPRISEDGIDFESGPKNSFRFGFGMKKGEKPSIDIRLGIRQQPSSGR